DIAENQTFYYLLDKKEIYIGDLSLKDVEVSEDGSEMRITNLRHDEFIPEKFNMEKIGDYKKDSIEVVAGGGRLIEKWDGERKGDEFIQETKKYMFYNGTADSYAKYNVADKTISVAIDDGKEYITGISIPSQRFENDDENGHEKGDVEYKTQKGAVLTPLDTAGKNNFEKYDLLFANGEKLDGIATSHKEIKDRRGHLKVMLNGYSEIDSNGFVQDTAEPEYITLFDLFNVDSKLFEITGIAKDSYTYNYDAAKGIEAKEYEKEDKNKDKWIAKTDNLKIEDGLLIYDAEDKRENKKSIARMGLHLDGRLYYQIHKGKWGRDDTMKLYFNTSELPDHTNLIGSKWNNERVNIPLLSSTEEQLYCEHYVVFVKDKPGHMWVWDRDVDDTGLKYKYIDEFVDGEQISADSPRVQVLAGDEAGKIAERDGRYFENSELIFERRDKFTPVVWRNYKETGLERSKEYFEIQITEHSGNNAISNLILEAKERKTLAPLIAVTSISAFVITVSLPGLLLFVTGILSRLHFRKTGQKRESTESGVIAGSTSRDGRVDTAFVEPERIDSRIRNRISAIIPPLCSIGPFVSYLHSLYVEGGFLEEDLAERGKREKALIKRFYPDWNGNESTKPIRTEAVWSGYKDKYGIELTEIEKLVIEPLAYIFLAAIAQDSRRLDDWTKGKGWEKGNPFQNNPDLLLVGDRDFRRFLEYCAEDKIDPFTGQPLAGSNAEAINGLDFREWLPIARKKIVNTKDDSSVIRKEKEENRDEYILNPIRSYLKNKYAKEGYKPYKFPQAFAQETTERKILSWSLAIAGVVLFSCLAYASGGFFIPPVAWLGLAVYSLFAWQLVETLPMMIFIAKYRIGGLITIYKASKSYEGSDEAKIERQVHFWKTFFKYWITANVAIIGPSIWYAGGTMPEMGWIFGGFVLLLTFIVSLRSWWNLLLEASAASLERQGHWRDIVSYNSIPKDSIGKVSKSSYLTDVYNTILVDETLLKYFMVTEEEAEALKTALKEGHEKLSPLENPRAKKKIVEFFNKVNLYNEEEMKEIKNFIRNNPGEFLKLITKTTSQAQLGVPTRASLDNASRAKGGGDIKTPFRILKEAYAGDWKVYLKYLAQNMNKSEKERFVEKFKDPLLSYENTLKEMIKAGILPIGKDKKHPLSQEDFDRKSKDELLANLEEELRHIPVPDLENLMERYELRFSAETEKPKLKNYWEKLNEHFQGMEEDNIRELVIELMLSRQIMHQWIIFRVDNVQKTVRTSHESSLAAYKVFLKHILNLDREPRTEEILKYYRGIFSYDIGLSDNVRKTHGTILFNNLEELGWKKGEWKNGKPKKFLATLAEFDANPEATFGVSGWGYKVDNWTYAIRHIDEEDGVIFNTDWEHMIFPVDVFLLPFVAYEFSKRKDLGEVETDLRDADEGMTPTAKDQTIAEDVWNTRMIPAETRIGTPAMYGPAIVRLPAMRDFGTPASKIEDSMTAHEMLKKGYKVDFAPGIRMGRGREKTQGGMPSFVNRFGGLIIDNALSVHFQQVLANIRMHWTEKFTLILNDDHYPNQMIIPRYNLIIFLFVFFVPFSLFTYLPIPLFFIYIQYIYNQAITSGGVRKLVREHGLWNGYGLYLKRFWSLVFTFLSLVPNDSQKTINALGGNSGQFVGGVKDVKYASESFNDLYGKFRESIKWGVLLLSILLIAPIHPWGIAAQFFFYVFPFAFIFGPFLHNGYSLKDSLRLKLKPYRSIKEEIQKRIDKNREGGKKDRRGFGDYIELLTSLPILNISIIKGIIHGVFAIPYFIFVDMIWKNVILRFRGKLIGLFSHDNMLRAKDSISSSLKVINKEHPIKPFAPKDMASMLNYTELQDSFIDSLEVGCDLSKTKKQRFSPIGEYSAELTKLLNNSFDGLEELVKQDKELNRYFNDRINHPDNRAPPIVVRVSSKLPTNSARYYNTTQQRVEIILNERFIKELLSAYDTHSEAVRTILAERLFHELGHDNKIGTSDKEKEEETHLIKQDLKFHKIIISTTQPQIDNYFKTQKPKFPSGYYFNFLNELLNIKDSDEIDLVIKAYLSKTGNELKNLYLEEIKDLSTKNKIHSLDPKQINFQITTEQENAYLKAIKEILQTEGEKVITPELLFKAAEIATKDCKSTVEAKIGLQPGTMNPLTYGHITASLGGIIGQELDAVILANGGTVPNKPYAANADIRNAMARKAVNQKGLEDWLLVTPIRQQMVEMFNRNGETLKLAGEDEKKRRFNMDMAGFIWLFVSNPNVEWYYLVGSDKVAGYGKKDERGLLEKTLRGHAKVIYFARTGEDIDIANDINKYDWLKKLWDSGFFAKSKVPSFADISATKVRTAIVNKDTEIGGIALTEMISSEVLKYIEGNKELLTLYELEINEKRAENLIIEEHNCGKALEIYKNSLELINNLPEKVIEQESSAKLSDKINRKITNLQKALKFAKRLEEGKVENSEIDSLSVEAMA
ncbi:MAG: hypothetical protein B5M53_05190, partial [Candidatus Cloacimonas sp. 4484_209]